jgi:hypothetical protein
MGLTIENRSDTALDFGISLLNVQNGGPNFNCYVWDAKDNEPYPPLGVIRNPWITIPAHSHKPTEFGCFYDNIFTLAIVKKHTQFCKDTNPMWDNYTNIVDGTNFFVSISASPGHEYVKTVYIDEMLKAIMSKNALFADRYFWRRVIGEMQDIWKSPNFYACPAPDLAYPKCYCSNSLKG